MIEQKVKKTTDALKIIEWVFGRKAIDSTCCRKELINVLNTIESREAIVLILRSAVGMTLREIGENIGITGQQVRRIETVALKKLRHPTKSRNLEKYLLETRLRISALSVHGYKKI